MAGQSNKTAIRNLNREKFYSSVIELPRDPTTTDVKNKLTGERFNTITYCINTTDGTLWYLAGFSSGNADWRKLAGASGSVTDLRDQVNTLVQPTASGYIDVDGSTVANGANPSGIPLETVGTTNTLTLQQQVATARTGAPGDKNDAGICSFDDTAFSVDADGYVTLAGGAGPAVDSVDVDFNTAPGTDPVVPTAAGVMQIYGNSVTNGTNANAPVATHSRAANQFHIDVQLSADITGAPGDHYDAGLCSFNDTQFVVDGNGYVSLVGGTDLPSVQTITGDDAVATGPDANGNMDLQGLAVANATNAKPLYFNGGTNSEVAEIQVSTAISSAPGDKNDAGICSFDSNDFTVDTDGFVQLSNSSGGGGASGFNIFDDFLAIGKDTEAWPLLGWDGGSWNADANAEAGHPGIVTLTTTGSDASLTPTITNKTGSIILGAGETTCEWVVKLPALSDGTDDYTIYCGLMDGSSVPTIANGCYFLYNHAANSGDYQIVCESGGTATTNNTADTATANTWVKFTVVVNAAATSVAFYVDGVECANSPITTNIPTSNQVCPQFWIDRNAGTNSRSFKADYCHYICNLTTSR